MAASSFNPFSAGLRLIDGDKLNKLFQGFRAFTGFALNGFNTQIPQLIAAAGATQGAAPLITKSTVFITVSTASARGVRLPSAATGLRCLLISLCTQGTKVYPFSNDKITSSATNVAVVIAGFKANLYVAENATQWGLFKGA